MHHSISSKSIALLSLVIMSFGLLLTRIIITGELTFTFLVWNLFLAYIPLGISTLVHLKRNEIERWQFWPIAGLWLLFFPNAPYILTDLFHLMPRERSQEWFDLLLIVAFAITGLVFGLLSLRNMHRTISRLYSQSTVILFVSCSIFLGSFGVYLGRFERYNSWDILRTPIEIFHDIAIRVLYPFEHPTTWGLTLGLSVLLAILYVFLGGVEVNNEKRQ